MTRFIGRFEATVGSKIIVTLYEVVEEFIHAGGDNAMLSNTLQQIETHLSVKQLAAIPMILGAGDISKGVRKAEISRVTFYRWMEDPEFRSEFNRQRDFILKTAINNIKLATMKAACTLVALLDDPSPVIRLKAATTLLEQSDRKVR